MSRSAPASTCAWVRNSPVWRARPSCAKSSTTSIGSRWSARRTWTTNPNLRGLTRMAVRLTPYSVAGRITTTDFAFALVAQQRNHLAVRSCRRIHAVDARRVQRPAVTGGLGLVGGQVAPRERQQARLVKGVRQPRGLGQFVERARLVEPESADARAPQRGEVAADAERFSDVAGQRPDVGAARAVHLDVDVDHARPTAGRRAPRSGRCAPALRPTRRSDLRGRVGMPACRRP